MVDPIYGFPAADQRPKRHFQHCAIGRTRIAARYQLEETFYQWALIQLKVASDVVVVLLRQAVRQMLNAAQYTLQQVLLKISRSTKAAEMQLHCM